MLFPLCCLSEEAFMAEKHKEPSSQRERVAEQGACLAGDLSRATSLQRIAENLGQTNSAQSLQTKGLMSGVEGFPALSHIKTKLKSIQLMDTGKNIKSVRMVSYHRLSAHPIVVLCQVAKSAPLFSSSFSPLQQ